MNTVKDIVDAILKTRNQTSHSIEVDPYSSTDISTPFSSFSRAVLRANHWSSVARLCESFGCRENLMEFYWHNSPVYQEESIACNDSNSNKDNIDNDSDNDNNNSNNNSRKQFCDFSLLGTISMVSVKMVALLIMELARNRWVEGFLHILSILLYHVTLCHEILLSGACAVC